MTSLRWAKSALEYGINNKIPKCKKRLVKYTRPDDFECCLEGLMLLEKGGEIGYSPITDAYGITDPDDGTINFFALSKNRPGDTLHFLLTKDFFRAIKELQLPYPAFDFYRETMNFISFNDRTDLSFDQMLAVVEKVISYYE